MFQSESFDGHESVHTFFDAASGLKAIIAIHSTVRGDALGGCRMHPYPSDQAALDDVLGLSSGMSYKSAVADLNFGGGKSVIIGDPSTGKTPELLRAFGRAVASLRGQYWTAEDMGIGPADLEFIHESAASVAGLDDSSAAASGDPSRITAEGVFRGIQLAVRHKLDSDLSGVTVAIQGVGGVGSKLAGKLHAAGARLVIADKDDERATQIAEETNGSKVAPQEIFSSAAEVFAPCAGSKPINEATLPLIKASIVAGAANVQLADIGLDQQLVDHGILYAPDFVINGGGVINVAAEIMARRQNAAYDPAWVETKLQALMGSLDTILGRAMTEKRSTAQLAYELARERIRSFCPSD